MRTINQLSLITSLIGVYSVPDAIIEYNPDNIDGVSLPNTGTGSTAYDLDLTEALNNNYASVDSFGNSCNALCFNDIADSSESCIAVPYNIDSSAVPNLSFELNIKQLSFTSHLEWIMSQDDGAFDRSILMKDTRFGGGDKLALGVGGTYTSTVNSLAEDEYVHLVAVFQPNTASLYLNGDLAQSTSVQQASVSSFNYFCLNTNPGHDSHGWNGCVNQVRVYESALTVEDVASLYQAYNQREASCIDPCAAVTCDDGEICSEGNCVLNCDVLDIDGFLLECSTEFSSQNADLQSQIDSNDGDITNNRNDIDTNTGDIATNGGDIDTLQSRVDVNEGGISTNGVNIADLQQRVADLEKTVRFLQGRRHRGGTGQSAGFGPDQGLDYDNMGDMDNMYKPYPVKSIWDSWGYIALGAVAILLMINIIIMAYNNCCNKQKKRYQRVRYVDTEDADSEANLK